MAGLAGATMVDRSEAEVHAANHTTHTCHITVFVKTTHNPRDLCTVFAPIFS